MPTLFSQHIEIFVVTTATEKGRLPEERQAETAAQDEKRLKHWMDSDSIKGFDDFAGNVSEKSSSLQTATLLLIEYK